jgi:thiol-disulfide isomerase/thioredoxin
MIRFRISLPVLLAVAGTAGVSLATRPIPALAAPKKAPCTVCSVREGSGPEAVKATATYQGKEYPFCTEKCRTEFLKDPQSFLKTFTPHPAPGFALKSLSGDTVSLDAYKGKVVLLDFWATFCGPCIKAMPQLQKLNDRHAAEGFAVLGIATDEEGAKVIAPVAAKTKVKYPILVSDAAAWKNYEVETLPALFLIDRDGKIVKRFGGNTDHKTIEQEVERLLGQPGGAR